MWRAICPRRRTWQSTPNSGAYEANTPSYEVRRQLKSQIMNRCRWCWGFFSYSDMRDVCKDARGLKAAVSRYSTTYREDELNEISVSFWLSSATLTYQFFFFPNQPARQEARPFPRNSFAISHQPSLVQDHHMSAARSTGPPMLGYLKQIFRPALRPCAATYQIIYAIRMQRLQGIET